ncbi:MAG TPA: YceI family protein [Tepidisphaeraceae bacterium]|jgi:polyisoprenoid-binding protein YceI|nr:YceI family protein [Tepidisphaeraceae bacterium]
MKRLVAVALFVACVSSFAFAAVPLTVDPVHSSFVFKVTHANIGHIWGHFSDYGGTFVIDDSNSAFDITVNPASVDTGAKKRDEHLQAPDYFNTKQYPAITFKSTAVKKVSDSRLEATGDLTLHGVTRSIVVPIEIVGKGEFPRGTGRVGIEATFSVKLSDYKIKGDPKSVADEILIIASLEGKDK